MDNFILTLAGSRSVLRGFLAFITAALAWSHSSHATPLLAILEPTSTQVSHLTPESNYTTHEMTFLSNLVAAPTVDWWVSSGYETHDGHGYADHNIYFSSTPGAPLTLTLSDSGGQSVVNASAYINGDFTRAYYVETFLLEPRYPASW